MKNIKCNLCNSDDCREIMKSIDRFYNIKDIVFSIVECKNCGLVYINPQPDPEELKKHYPFEYGPYNSDFKLLKYGPFTGFLKKFVTKLKNRGKNKTQQKKEDMSEDTFLDIGCGSGAHLEKMRKNHPHWQLYGLDNSEFACQSARSKGFEVFCGDTLELSLPKNFFDHIYMGQVIEHVENPMSVIKKVSSLLKEGGTFTLITPNIDSIAAKIFRNFWFALEVPRHLYLFSNKTLSKMLQKNGFEVKSIIYDKEPKTAVRSLSYIFYNRSVDINPVFWHAFWYLLNPVSVLLALFGKTSIMTVQAQKQPDPNSSI